MYFMFLMEQFEKLYPREFQFIPFCSFFIKEIVQFKMNELVCHNYPYLFPYRGLKSVLLHKGTILVKCGELSVL